MPESRICGGGTRAFDIRDANGPFSSGGARTGLHVAAPSIHRGSADEQNRLCVVADRAVCRFAGPRRPAAGRGFEQCEVPERAPGRKDQSGRARRPSGGHECRRERHRERRGIGRGRRTRGMRLSRFAAGSSARPAATEAAQDRPYAGHRLEPAACSPAHDTREPGAHPDPCHRRRSGSSRRAAESEDAHAAQ